MAYITKAEVKEKSKALALLNKLYGVKATFSGSNSNCITLTIHSGRLDFIGNACYNADKNLILTREARIASLIRKGYIQVNHYHIDRSFSGSCLGYLHQAYEIMLDGHFDNSDIQTDYFSCAWYNAIRIGRWDKPYTVTE